MGTLEFPFDEIGLPVGQGFTTDLGFNGRCEAENGRITAIWLNASKPNPSRDSGRWIGTEHPVSNGSYLFRQISATLERSSHYAELIASTAPAKRRRRHEPSAPIRLSAAAG